MSWVILVIAGLAEMGWAIGMKYSRGFTCPLASAVTIILIVFSLTLLNFSLKSLPVGIAYGVWTGIGTVGTMLLGIILFGEPVTLSRLICITLIIAGIIGLRVVAG